MDSLLGIGMPEMALILLLAGLVMGPERIRPAARWLGRALAQLQGLTATFMRQVNAELDGVDRTGDVKATLAEVQDLRRQVEDLRRELFSVSTQPLREGEAAVRESQAALRETRAALDERLRLAAREKTAAIQARTTAPKEPEGVS
jgi:Sec-independent protein translocase protein TatA